MRKFDLYEFVGLIVPGTFLLLCYSALFSGELPRLPMPGDVGGLVVYLVVAYALGHLIQIPGQLVETLYWKLWGGLPTDWPVTRPARDRFPRAVESIAEATGRTPPRAVETAADLASWRSLVAEARATLYATGRATRLEVFNANYGLFRGVLTTVLAAAAVAWLSIEVDRVNAYLVLLAVGFLAERRLHHFATLYARELFANAAGVNR